MIDVVVVELGQVVSAPYCGMILSQLGATVIKVEPPGAGDAFRGPGPEASPAFAALNRGKLSVTLDLKTRQGREALLALVADADALVENFRPGGLESLGIGYGDLSAVNPGLVHCGITGFGDAGEYRDRAGFDPLAQALSGLWSQYTDLNDPEAVGPPTSDLLAGMYAAHHILDGLLERQRTGLGRSVDVSLLSAALSFQILATERYRREGELPDHKSRSRHSQTYPLVACDGPFTIHLSSRDAYWRAMLTALDAQDLVDDPRFVDHAGRCAHYDELRTELLARCRDRTRSEWLARLAAARVPAAPILDLAAALQHDQVMEVMTQPPDGGRGLPVLGRDRWHGVHRPGEPPELGEHTASILAELRGTRRTSSSAQDI